MTCLQCLQCLNGRGAREESQRAAAEETEGERDPRPAGSHQVSGEEEAKAGGQRKICQKRARKEHRGAASGWEVV
ncbi:hypothetical protein HOLleu_30755 [Holothuria leucospilota]|uniref:Uncharacterized protein n=1 Tax=Holothuria leucospilota TaxID=206669 RepID=A0A9Q1H1E7_HOLLE|nr:hypothetical protein HOLleu_30755 [Holothuria leucospilota]